MAALQITQAKAEFLLLKQDISDVGTSTFRQWCNMINRYAFRALKATEPQMFIKETTYSVSTSPSYQALPVDFRDIKEDGTGFYYTDDAGELTPIRLPMTGHGSESTGYYLERGNVVFTGINDSQLYVLRYIPQLVTLATDDQYFTLDGTSSGVIIIDDEYIDYVLQALDVRYSQWDEDSSMEGNADQRFSRVLDEFLEQVPRTPRVFSIPDVSSAF